jgi:hypothetical protein
VKKAYKSPREKGWGKTCRKERFMGKKSCYALLIAAIFLFCLSCASESLPDQGVKILSPKASDVFKTGDFYEILWKAEPAESEFGAMVTVEFSKDGGKSWEKVEENVPDNGKYLWRIPKADSTQCKVRVFSQRRPIYRGTSEVFAVK